jgi:uncharacterized membrane protein YhaH (DUF805 family)
MADPVVTDSSPNRYAAPHAKVADIYPVEGDTQPVRLFSIKGRMGRLRYIFWGGVFLLVFILLNGIATYMTLGKAGFTEDVDFPEWVESGFGFFFMVIVTVWLVLQIRLMIQRSHDMGWSGWSIFILFLFISFGRVVGLFVMQRLELPVAEVFIDLVIDLVVCIWMIKPGTSGFNRFGAPPASTPRFVQVGAWIFVALGTFYIFWMLRSEL